MRHVIIDFETYPVAGVSHIMEIGCIELKDGGLGSSFHSLIRPLCKVSPFVLTLTGIHESDLMVAPTFSDIVASFHDFLDDAVIIAHNAPLDESSYYASCHSHGVTPLERTWIDSQNIIKWMIPTIPSLRLSELVSLYDIPTSASHRALDDAVGLAHLLMAIRDQHSMTLSTHEYNMAYGASDGMRQLMTVLTRFFKISIVDDPPSLPEKCPLYYSPPSPSPLTPSPIINHINAPLHALSPPTSPTLIVTPHPIMDDGPYIDDPTHRIRPSDRYSFYLATTTSCRTLLEYVEVMAIIHWFRQSTTRQKRDLNQSLIERFNRIHVMTHDNDHIHSFHSVMARLNRARSTHCVIQCHWHAVLAIVRHAPRVLSQFNVVIHNTSPLHRHTPYNMMPSVSFKTMLFFLFKNTQIILYHVDTYRYHSRPESNTAFPHRITIQHIARIRDQLPSIHTAIKTLAFKLYGLIQKVGPVSNESGQIIPGNSTLYAHLEWTDCQTIMTTIGDQLGTINRMIEQIPTTNNPLISRITALVIQHNQWLKQWFIRMKRSPTILSDSKNPLSLQMGLSPIRDIPSLCRHVNRYARSLTVHQPIILGMTHPTYLTQLLGRLTPPSKQLSLDPLCTIMVTDITPLQQWVDHRRKTSIVYVICHNKTRVAYWRKKLNRSRPGHHRLIILPIHQCHTIRYSFPCCILIPESPRRPVSCGPNTTLDQRLTEALYDYFNRIMPPPACPVFFNISTRIARTYPSLF